ncbi:hypothetical protein ANN_09874 [Periplaneta americana]|uniref:Uncharacterized protein n=1 Tax=Periplaneta americana TaxID=6978 RepID=A0ABQ8TML8_PERAM|nr:hypothetical protein ANN_09874 [Periplaneta americana]
MQEKNIQQAQGKYIQLECQALAAYAEENVVICFSETEKASILKQKYDSGSIFITLVASEQFKCIIYYFPIKGHNFLPCDPNFARIAKIKRKKEKVETPREWEDIVKNEANFNVETFKNTNT